MIKGVGIGFYEVYKLYQKGNKENINVFESLLEIDEGSAYRFIDGL